MCNWKLSTVNCKFLASCGRRRLGRLGGLGGFLFPLLHVLLEEHRDLLRRQRAHAQPVLDAVRLQRHALVGLLDLRIVGAQLLEDAAVARLPRIDRHDPEIMPVLPPHHLHAYAYGHDFTFLVVSAILSLLKFEIRISKSETKSKSQCSKYRNQRLFGFRISSLFRISRFGFRVYLPFLRFFFLSSARSFGVLWFPVPIFCLGIMAPGWNIPALPRPVIILMRCHRLICAICRMSVRICSNCWRNCLISWGSTPLPAAMRRRRPISMISGSRRSAFVIESIMPWMRLIATSGSSPSGIMSPMPGMDAMMSFMGPIFFICSNCLRKSSSVKSPLASLACCF